VLVLGNYRPTLTVVRTLGRDGFNVVLGRGHDPEGSAQYSRHVREIWDHPPLDGQGKPNFLTALSRLLVRRGDIQILYPTSEDMALWLADNADRLPRKVLIASPPPSLVRICLDKLRMAEFARLESVPCQPFAAAGSLRELEAAAGRIGYPLVVRPLDHLQRIGTRKAVIVETADDLAKAMPAWPEGHARLLVQRFATGERWNVYFAAQDGEVLRSLEVRAVRTDKLDGTGLSVEGEIVRAPVPLPEYVARLARCLHYTGIGCAQFLVDPATKDVSFLEINPRIAGHHRCTEMMGMDLTRLAIRLAGTMAADEARGSLSPERPIRFCWTYGDLGGLKAAVAAREIGPLRAMLWLGRAAIGFARADFHVTWDAKDPWPTLILFAKRMLGVSRLPRLRFSRPSAGAELLRPAAPRTSRAVG
jgi:predicted ATP-grasp superfamily ATP-dependent carboligase